MFDFPHLTVIGLVVVPHQMEESMNKEQGDLLLSGVPQFDGFGLGMIERDDDGTQGEVLMLSFEREAEDIGGFVDVAVGVVELPNHCIVTEDEFDLPLRTGVGNGLEQSNIKTEFGVVFQKNHMIVYQK